MTLLRSVVRSVKLPQRLPQSSGRGGPFGGMSSLMGSDAQSGIDLYKSIGAVHGPYRRLAISVALTNWSLYEQTAKAGKVERDLIDDATAPARHPGTAIWTRPNEFMTRRVFLFLTEILKLTCGGVYWLICQGGVEGSPFLQPGVSAGLELWPIRKDRITPVPDPDKYLAGYVYHNGAEKIPLPVQAVVPIGWPDPANPLDFAGPLQSVLTDMESEKYASQYQRNVFLNNARPGGIIEYETPLSPDRFDEVVLRWREQHQGVNNAARVAIIEGGKWVDVGQSNSDMEYEKLRKLDRETSMFAAGIPFAVMQSNDVNLANATMADKQFYRWTLRPELEDLKEPLNLRVLPYLGDNLTMDYELPAPEDEAFDMFAGVSGWLSGVTTQNEARAAMGYDGIPEGDRYVFDLPNAAPGKPPTTPGMMPPRPPRRPTNLSYGGAPAGMGDELAGRLAAVTAGYESLLRQRNGRGYSGN